MTALRPLFAAALALAALLPSARCLPASAGARSAGGPSRTEVVAALQAVSVTVSVPGHWGSGTLIQRDGVTYCWTAGHVAESLKDGESWHEAVLWDTEVAGGLSKNVSLGTARLLRISDSEKGDDLALLRLDKPVAGPGARFFLTDAVPAVGTPVYHIGSFLGIDYSGSFSAGFVSALGRVQSGLPAGVEFDQMTATSFPGSSGGGVFMTDGRDIGMLVRGAGETLGLYVPVRRMRRWAKRQGLDFALDPSRPVPADLDSHAVTDGEGQ